MLLLGVCIMSVIGKLCLCATHYNSVVCILVYPSELLMLACALALHSYNSPNRDGIPPGGLRYLLSNENATSQIDDDGFEIGVNGTVGGFTSIYISKQNMTVRFHDQNGTVLYSSWVPPRDLGNDGGGSKKLDPEYVIIIVVSAVAVAIAIALAVYFLYLKKRWMTRGSSLAPEGVDELKHSTHTGVPLLAEEAGK